MENILYLGSKSQARHQLLKDAQINFVVVDQSADETQCPILPSLQETVQIIARYKMDHVILPSINDAFWKISGEKGQEFRFVLTADTLTQNHDGSLAGKPKDKQEAITMIKRARFGATVGTAFCLDKKVWHANIASKNIAPGKKECGSNKPLDGGIEQGDGKWVTEKRIEKFVSASYDLEIEDEWIETYLSKSFGSVASGAVAIEGYGQQFLKTVNGSHSTIVGLPMFELRRALQELGFFTCL